MMSRIKQQVPKPVRDKLYITLAVLLIILLMCAIYRIVETIQLSHTTERQAVLPVSVMQVTPNEVNDTIMLPGNIQGWHQAPIYARTNGYLKQWLVDIGSYVKAGDLLATIESPEIDAQLRQAEADLKTAEANADIADISAKRWVNLLKTDSVSKQETDQRIATAKSTKATVLAMKANRDRLKDLTGFERVLAPFDGVITSRSVDIGDLINSGSQTPQQSLFTIAQADKLRIYVRVPQNYTTMIKPGMTIGLQFHEHPGKTFRASLYRTADAIDQNTRTLLAQFIIDNTNHILLPGSYTRVHMIFPPTTGSVVLPVNTLLFRAQGLEVATVSKDGVVTLKKAKISRDYGNKVEISHGIEMGEQVIINPPDSLADQQKVRIVSVVKFGKDGNLI